MTQTRNGFEGGTNGAAVTVANSGGASGDAWTAVATGTSGSRTYSNAHAAHGLLSMAVQQGATAAQTYVEKTFPGNTTSVADRIYLYLTANPGASTPIVQFVTSGGVSNARLRVNSTGKLQALDAANAAIADTLFASACPLNAWFRVEIVATLSATVGQITISRYDTMDSATPTETVTSAANKNLGGAVDRVRYGIPSSVANVGPFYFDDIAQNDTGTAIGPYLPHGSGSSTATATSAGTGHSLRHGGGTSTATSSSTGAGYSVRHGSGSTNATTTTTGGGGHSLRHAAGSSTTTTASSGTGTSGRHAAGSSLTTASSSGAGTSARHSSGSTTATCVSSGSGHGTGSGESYATTTSTGTGHAHHHAAGLSTPASSASSGTGHSVRHAAGASTVTTTSTGGGGRSRRSGAGVTLITTTSSGHGQSRRHGAGASTATGLSVGVGHHVLGGAFLGQRWGRLAAQPPRGAGRLSPTPSSGGTLTGRR